MISPHIVIRAEFYIKMSYDFLPLQDTGTLSEAKLGTCHTVSRKK